MLIHLPLPLPIQFNSIFRSIRSVNIYLEDSDRTGTGTGTGTGASSTTLPHHRYRSEGRLLVIQKAMDYGVYIHLLGSTSYFNKIIQVTHIVYIHAYIHTHSSTYIW